MKITVKNPTKLPTIPWQELKEDYEPNALKQREGQLEKLKKSITEYGFVFPLVIWKEGRYITDGASRIYALESLESDGYKIPDIPYILITAKDKKEAKMLTMLASSRYRKETAKSMKEFTEDIIDLDFSPVVIENFDLDLNTELDIDDDEDDGYVHEIPKNPKSKQGDIYELGDHVLMCGDATSHEDVNKLMGGGKADMVFTDPPYALFGNSTGVSGVVDDKMTRPFFLEVFKMMKLHTKLFAHLYTCCDWHSAFSLQSMAREMELKEKNLCIWDKGDGGIGGNYQMCYEMVWFHSNSPVSRKTTGRTKAGERIIHGKPNIWRYPRVSTNRIHNAQKPVEMIAFAIEASTDPGETVLDLFGGSGSTLIAAQHTNRACRIMEIEPAYVDVIIQRWESLTGEKAKKVS